MLSRRCLLLGGLGFAGAGCAPAAEAEGPAADGVARAQARGSFGRAERVTAPRATATAGVAASAAPAFTPEAPRAPTEAERALYGFLPEGAKIRALDRTVAPPAGFERVALEEGSFGAYLRGLPLRPAGASVHAYDGSLLREPDDPRVFAVAELDVSPLDVQQCADSVIRLHAEWLWSKGAKDRIGYHFLSGDFATYARYAAGDRPEVDGHRVRWSRSAPPADGRKTFRKYLDMVFNYASTISLAHRTEKIDRASLRPGDFVVLPGGPGHAILVLDVAADAEGRRAALLGQGFMPAQDFHVLASREGGRSPWFSLEVEAIDTPFWPEAFPWSSARRLPGGS